MSGNNKIRLRWKRDAAETGLRSVGARPRGWHFHDGEETFAHVSPNGGGWGSIQNGWYWVAYSRGDMPLKNTHREPCETPEQAKEQAAAYVKSYLGEGK